MIMPIPPKKIALRLLLSLPLIGLSSLQASTLYWNSSSPSSGSFTTGNNWAVTPTGSPSANFTSGADSAVITASNPTISITGAITALGWDVQNDATINSAATGAISLTLSGGNPMDGDFSFNGQSTGSARFILQNTTAYNGTIANIGNATSGIVLSGTSATSTATSIALNGAGSLNLDTVFVGGTATIGQLSGNNSAAIVSANFGATTGTRTLKVDQSTNTTYAGSFAAGTTNRVLSVIKDGSGRLRVMGASTTNGDTIVAAGTLLVNGVTSNQGSYTVNSNAILGGNGTIGLKTSNLVTVNSGGILDPGDISDSGVATPGTLTIVGLSSTGAGLSFLGSATINFTLGSVKDLIALTSSNMIGAASGGANSIDFNLGDFGDTQIGTTYDLISFGGTTQGIALNTFGLSTGSVSSGWAGTFGYGGDGNTLQFTVSAVPEPATITLLGFALVFAITRIRKLRTV